MSDQIEMWWCCKACGTVNGGLSKRCGERPVVNGRVVPPKSDLGCGKRQEDESWFPPDDISARAAIRDRDHLRQALDGPDWVCGYCGSTTKRADGECANCGGDPNFNASERNDDVRVQEHKGERQVEKLDTPWKKERPTLDETPSSKRSHRPRVRTAGKTGIKPPDDFPWDEIEDERMFRSASKGRPFPTIPVVIGGVVIAVTALLLFLLWPRYVDGQVAYVHWDVKVNVERYQVIKNEGWDPPGDAFDEIDLGRRVHHHERVQVGTRQETYTESYNCGQTCTPIPRTCTTTPRTCSSNKNGTMNCSGGNQVCTGGGQRCVPKTCTRPATRTIPVYENQPRYRNWYSWKAWRWRKNRTIPRSGDDLNPQLPPKEKIRLNVGCQGKEKERSSPQWTYLTTFKDKKGETYKYVPKSEGEFKSLPVGTQKRLRLVAGTVTIVESK